MPLVRLKHGWPTDQFRRTLKVGKQKPKQIVFGKKDPISVTDAQLEVLATRDAGPLEIVDDRGKRHPLVAEMTNDQAPMTNDQ